MRTRIKTLGIVPVVSALLVCLFAASASAQQVFHRPASHPRYDVELEPLIEFGLADPPGAVTGLGIGFGLRAGIPILKRGLLPSRNDTLDLTFGLSWVYYGGGSPFRGDCTDRDGVPGVGAICVEVEDQAGNSNYWYLPVGAQWNLWLRRELSVFASLGLVAYLRNDEGDGLDFSVAPLAQVGARWHFERKMHLVVRLGYPTSSVGVGWFF